jgi:uncharacterized membrane protein YkoI
MAFFMKNTVLTLFLSLLLITNAPLITAAEGVSKQQAVTTAQQVHPGRVLSVKREGSVYRVKILSDSGEVRVVLVEVSSGKVVSQ